MLVCLLHRKGRAGFSLDENQGLARCSGLIYLANVRYWIPEMVDFTPLQNALLADLAGGQLTPRPEHGKDDHARG